MIIVIILLRVRCNGAVAKRKRMAGLSAPPESLRIDLCHSGEPSQTFSLYPPPKKSSLPSPLPITLHFVTSILKQPHSGALLFSSPPLLSTIHTPLQHLSAASIPSILMASPSFTVISTVMMSLYRSFHLSFTRALSLPLALTDWVSESRCCP